MAHPMPSPSPSTPTAPRPAAGPGATGRPAALRPAGMAARAAWRFVDGSHHGWATDALLASYLHLHWAGVPGAAARLIAAARVAASRQQ